MTKAANEVDRHVGSRVRMRRILLGMSQEKLADAIGITFQQVQKYEKGTNRISASRLRQITDVLGVSLDFLYDGLSTPSSPGFADGKSASPYEAYILTAEGLKLARSFQRISDPAVRRKIVELVAALAALDGKTESHPE